jgi:hypothetical protein
MLFGKHVFGDGWLNRQEQGQQAAALMHSDALMLSRVNHYCVSATVALAVWY